MTKIELVIVLTIIALLAAVLLPMVARANSKRRQTGCLNNLKQIGLGFRIWSNDGGDKFAFATSAENGGTLEYAATPQVFRHFQIASNEFSVTKILLCPNDRTRDTAKDWSSLNNSNLSYFVGLDADEGRPQRILSGDRTISTNGKLMPGFRQVSGDALVVWANGIHPGFGNIGLSDGSAHQASMPDLQAQWKVQNMDSTNVFPSDNTWRLAIP